MRHRLAEESCAYRRGANGARLLPPGKPTTRRASRQAKFEYRCQATVGSVYHLHEQIHSLIPLFLLLLWKSESMCPAPRLCCILTETRLDFALELFFSAGPASKEALMRPKTRSSLSCLGAGTPAGHRRLLRPDAPILWSLCLVFLPIAAEASNPSASASLEYLRRVQDQFHDRIPVYEDVRVGR